MYLFIVATPSRTDVNLIIASTYITGVHVLFQAYPQLGRGYSKDDNEAGGGEEAVILDPDTEEESE